MINGRSLSERVPWGLLVLGSFFLLAATAILAAILAALLQQLSPSAPAPAPAAPAAPKGAEPAFDPKHFDRSAEWLLGFVERYDALPRDNEVALGKQADGLLAAIQAVSGQKVQWRANVSRVSHDPGRERATVHVAPYASNGNEVRLIDIHVSPAEAEPLRTGDAVRVEGTVGLITHNLASSGAKRVFHVTVGPATIRRDH